MLTSTESLSRRGMAVFAVVFALALAVWAFMSMVRHAGDVFRGSAPPPSPHLLGDSGVKIFSRNAHSPKCPGAPNVLECTDRYCYACPSQILCTPLNPAFHESSPGQLWSCTGRIESGNDGVELAGHEMQCEGGASEGNPRCGCTLKLHMRGPWTGWSPLAEFSYDLLVFVACVMFLLLWAAGGGKTGVLLGGGGGGGGGGGSHMSTSFG